jgi:hypothetical protein
VVFELVSSNLSVVELSSGFFCEKDVKVLENEYNLAQWYCTKFLFQESKIVPIVYFKVF